MKLPLVYKSGDDIFIEWRSVGKTLGMIISPDLEECGWFFASREFAWDEGFSPELTEKIKLMFKEDAYGNQE